MFSNGAYAKLWDIKKVDGKNYYQGRLSTSRKNQKGEYEQDFSDGFVRFVGNAATKAAQLSGNERIKIENCGVTNSYDKEKKITYWNCTIFDFSLVGGNQEKKKDNSFNNIPDGVDDGELPFN